MVTLDLNANDFPGYGTNLINTRSNGLKFRFHFKIAVVGVFSVCQVIESSDPVFASSVKYFIKVLKDSAVCCY